MPPGRRRVNLREVARQGREGTLRALRAECVGRTPRACDRAGPPCLVPEVGAFTGELPTRHRAERGRQRDGLRLLFPGCLQLRTIPRPEGRPCPAGAAVRAAWTGRPWPAVSRALRFSCTFAGACQARGTMSGPQASCRKSGGSPTPRPPLSAVWQGQSESRGDGMLGTLAREPRPLSTAGDCVVGGQTICPTLDCGGRGAKGVSVRSRKGAPGPGRPPTITQTPCGPRRVRDLPLKVPLHQRGPGR